MSRHCALCMLRPKFCMLQPSLHMSQQNLASEEAKICLSKSSFIILSFLSRPKSGKFHCFNPSLKEEISFLQQQIVSNHSYLAIHCSRKIFSSIIDSKIKLNVPKNSVCYSEYELIFRAHDWSFVKFLAFSLVETNIVPILLSIIQLTGLDCPEIEN